MSHEALGNLLRIGQLKSEPFDALEFDRLLKMARSGCSAPKAQPG